MRIYRTLMSYIELLYATALGQPPTSMNEKKKAKIKDEILQLLTVKGTKSDVYGIADTLKENVKLITYLAEELRDEGLVELMEVTSKHSEVPREYILKQTNKGTYFLTFDGGHKQRLRDKRIETIWTTVKIIAGIVNALAVIAIGIYSVYITDKSDRLEKENEKLKTEILKKSK
jgi:hypothetical protein